MKLCDLSLMCFFEFLNFTATLLCVVLEQGPAATEEAASFGGKRTRQSYDAVARFQLESKAENREFLGCESKRKETVPERPRRESSPTALKAAAEDRRAQ